MAVISTKINMVIRTRQWFGAVQRDVFSTIKRVLLAIDYDDAEAMTVVLTADGGRIIDTWTLAQIRQSGMAANDTIRHMAVGHCLEGMTGNAFDVKITKTISATLSTARKVHYHGCQLEAEAENVEDEFTIGTAVRTARTFVVEADSTPEVDAYA